MLVSDTSGAQPETGYNPETKCCTYMPELWNFLVGRILDDDSADTALGRASVEARIDRDWSSRRSGSAVAARSD